MCASTSKEASDNVGQGATRERVGVGVALAALAKRIRFTHILDAAGVNLARDEELQVELVNVGLLPLPIATITTRGSARGHSKYDLHP